MKTSRRGLLGRLLGAALVPVAAKVAEAKAPEAAPLKEFDLGELVPSLPRLPYTVALPPYARVVTYYITVTGIHGYGGAGGTSGGGGGMSASGGAGSGYVNAQWVRFR